MIAKITPQSNHSQILPQSTKQLAINQTINQLQQLMANNNQLLQYYSTASSTSSNLQTATYSASSTSASSILKQFSNVSFYQDAQDLYTNGVGRIKIHDGQDCVIELPDGRFIHVDENGNASTDDLPYVKKVSLLTLKEGRECRIEMPDGCVIDVDVKGNYRINDKDTKVVYKANRIREFNPFINASDILEDFIRYVGKLGVTQSQLMDLPIELFINFLIIRAAEADGDPKPADMDIESHPAIKALPSPKNHDVRCRSCGKFITKSKQRLGLEFCSENHMVVFARKQAAF